MIASVEPFKNVYIKWFCIDSCNGLMAPCTMSSWKCDGQMQLKINFKKSTTPKLGIREPFRNAHLQNGWDWRFLGRIQKPQCNRFTSVGSWLIWMHLSAMILMRMRRKFRSISDWFHNREQTTHLSMRWCLTHILHGTTTIFLTWNSVDALHSGRIPSLPIIKIRNWLYFNWTKNSWHMHANRMQRRNNNNYNNRTRHSIECHRSSFFISQ